MPFWVGIPSKIILSPAFTYFVATWVRCRCGVPNACDVSRTKIRLNGGPPQPPANRETRSEIAPNSNADQAHPLSTKDFACNIPGTFARDTWKLAGQPNPKFFRSFSRSATNNYHRVCVVICWAVPLRVDELTKQFVSHKRVPAAYRDEDKPAAHLQRAERNFPSRTCSLSLIHI